MISCGKSAVWSSDLAAGSFQTLKRLLGAPVSMLLGRRLEKVLTGEVTSWTKCLSVQSVSMCVDICGRECRCWHTDVEQDCAIEPLIYNMVLEDFIVQRSRSILSCRHACCSSEGGFGGTCVCMCVWIRGRSYVMS